MRLILSAKLLHRFQFVTVEMFKANFTISYFSYLIQKIQKKQKLGVKERENIFLAAA